MIADNNVYNLLMINNYLRTINICADEAVNGKDAIAKIINKAKCNCCKKYEIVFMDVNMPIINGIDASLILKKKIEKKTLPKIILIALIPELWTDEELSSDANTSELQSIR